MQQQSLKSRQAPLSPMQTRVLYHKSTVKAYMSFYTIAIKFYLQS